MSDDGSWAVDSWTFYWTVETLVARVGSPVLAERLREIDDHHLGSFALDDFPPDQRADLVAQILLLPQVADETLPASDGRETFIATVQELADMVAAEEA